MAHAIERLADGTYSMAWAGDVPWHGLGKKVPSDLTPEQMLQAAGLDWEVVKAPGFADLNGERVDIGRSALIRTSDNSVLDVVSSDWHPLQNAEAFGFFHDWVMAGDMEMHTAGSLRDGKIVWALAKMKSSAIELFKGRDVIEPYMLFTNPHQYGWSVDVRLTPIRVVCNNTITVALSKGTGADKVVRVSHRNQFNAEEVKETMGIAHDKLNRYAEAAAFLGSKRYKDETMVDYFREMFPGGSFNEDGSRELSRTARVATDIVETQPGADVAPGSFWNLFNGVTFLVDHHVGRSTDTRVANAWYGGARTLKQKALRRAVELAEAA